MLLLKEGMKNQKVGSTAARTCVLLLRKGGTIRRVAACKASPVAPPLDLHNVAVEGPAHVLKVGEDEGL